ncbi:2-oxoglutarate dehydrogenase complex dihydrolipoyllysine-residue succinyltransferase [Chlamydiia bacterium]|nr:2-oxoglutarate dehydrogenase complex dihydrolipoyllysine-residue succinyltransferase [Chlamydiia bacterium]
MVIEIKVPELGESISEAYIARLLVEDGDLVQRDQELMEFETDKLSQTIASDCAGKLSWKVNEGDTVSIGHIVCSIDESFSVPKNSNLKKSYQNNKQSEPINTNEDGIRHFKDPKTITSEVVLNKEKRVKAVVAEQKNSGDIDYQSTINTNDVTPNETRKRMSQLRKAISRTMMQATNDAAMLTTFNEVDMSEIMTIRSENKEQFIERHGVKLGFMSFFVKAVCSALSEYPDVGAMIDGDEIVQKQSMDLGIAVSTDSGLLVPVVKNCKHKTLADIERSILDFAMKARENKLGVQDLQGGIFTITNGGVFGSLLSTPIINYPQSAILGMHAIKKRVVVVDDQVVIRPMMYLALSYDHRIVDGKTAVLFLAHIKKLLEEPINFGLEL